MAAGHRRQQAGFVAVDTHLPLVAPVFADFTSEIFASFPRISPEAVTSGFDEDSAVAAKSVFILATVFKNKSNLRDKAQCAAIEDPEDIS